MSTTEAPIPQKQPTKLGAATWIEMVMVVEATNKKPGFIMRWD